MDCLCLLRRQHFRVKCQALPVPPSTMAFRSRCFLQRGGTVQQVLSVQPLQVFTMPHALVRAKIIRHLPSMLLSPQCQIFRAFLVFESWGNTKTRKELASSEKIWSWIMDMVLAVRVLSTS